jgi:hypothetical protein
LLYTNHHELHPFVACSLQICARRPSSTIETANSMESNQSDIERYGIWVVCICTNDP